MPADKLTSHDTRATLTAPRFARGVTAWMPVVVLGLVGYDLRNEAAEDILNEAAETIFTTAEGSVIGLTAPRQ